MTGPDKPRSRSKSAASGSRFQPGMHVEVLRTIVQGDGAVDPHAAPGEPGWLHAAPGDRGFVMQIDALGLPTVHFPRTGTDSLCFPHEIRVIQLL